VSLGELVVAAASGDEIAWSALVDRFAGLIWSIARASGLDSTDAADVSQTVWLRLAEHLDAIREPEHIGSWLATTTRRESARVGKLGTRDLLVDPWGELDLVESEEAEPLARLVTRERDLQMQQAVATLPARCQRLLTALIEEPPVAYAELSSRLGLPVGSIGPTRGRCLDHLRRLLADLDTRANLVQGTI
jgi:RNA polymerase sigma factor (sigma-70 family)